MNIKSFISQINNQPEFLSVREILLISLCYCLAYEIRVLLAVPLSKGKDLPFIPLAKIDFTDIPAVISCTEHLAANTPHIRFSGVL